MTLRRRQLAPLAAGSVAALASPGVQAQPADRSVTIATGGSITSLDPHFFNAAPNSSLALHIFNALTERSPDAKLLPSPRRQLAPHRADAVGIQAARGRAVA
jgi:peptide/nickel transport system substrate-binding protein